MTGVRDHADIGVDILNRPDSLQFFLTLKNLTGITMCKCACEISKLNCSKSLFFMKLFE